MGRLGPPSAVPEGGANQNLCPCPCLDPPRATVCSDARAHAHAVFDPRRRPPCAQARALAVDENVEQGAAARKRAEEKQEKLRQAKSKHKRRQFQEEQKQLQLQLQQLEDGLSTADILEWRRFAELQASCLSPLPLPCAAPSPPLLRSPRRAAAGLGGAPDRRRVRRRRVPIQGAVHAQVARAERRHAGPPWPSSPPLESPGREGWAPTKAPSATARPARKHAGVAARRRRPRRCTSSPRSTQTRARWAR